MLHSSLRDFLAFGRTCLVTRMKIHSLIWLCNYEFRVFFCVLFPLNPTQCTRRSVWFCPGDFLVVLTEDYIWSTGSTVSSWRNTKSAGYVSSPVFSHSLLFILPDFKSSRLNAYCQTQLGYLAWFRLPFMQISSITTYRGNFSLFRLLLPFLPPLWKARLLWKQF